MGTAAAAAAAAAAFRGQRVWISSSMQPDHAARLQKLLADGGATVLVGGTAGATRTDYVVLDAFHGEEFNELSGRHCQIIGPVCVEQCARSGKALPRLQHGTSICCRGLEGIVVTGTGLEKKEEEKIKMKVERMSGVYKHIRDASLSKADIEGVHYLVGTVPFAVGEKSKYWWAQQLGKHIVSPDWVHRSWDRHCTDDWQQNEVKPFTGMILCVTGPDIQGEERKRIRQLTEQHGGCYLADLQTTCTHLIATISSMRAATRVLNTDSVKYAQALKRGIHVVSLRWFYNCVEQKARLEEAKYPVSQPTMQLQSLAPSLSGSMTLSAAVNIQTPAVQSNSKEPQCVPMERTTTANALSEDDDSLYLASCRIFLAGFDGDSLRYMVKLVRQGGGTRYAEYNPTITHVVVGKADSSELKTLRAKASTATPHFVRAAWLEQCVQLQMQLSELPYNLSQAELFGPLQQPQHRQQAASRVTALFEDDGSPDDPGSTRWQQKQQKDSMIVAPSRDQSQNRMASVRERVEQRLQAELRRTASEKDDWVVKNSLHGKPDRRLLPSSQSLLIDYPESQRVVQPTAGVYEQTDDKFPGLSGQVLKGKRISFVADLQQPQNIQTVQNAGGVLCDRDESPDYLIGSCSSLNNPRCSLCPIVTLAWLEACCRRNELLDPYGSITYQPLPVALPLSNMANIKVSVSGFADSERSALLQLAKVLGGKSYETLSRKTTHLIAEKQGTEKCQKAAEWGTVVVSSAWLYSCAKQGKLLPAEDFSLMEAPLLGSAANASIADVPQMALVRRASLVKTTIVSSNIIEPQPSSSQAKAAAGVGRKPKPQKRARVQKITLTCTQSLAARVDPWDAGSSPWTQASQEPVADVVDEPQHVEQEQKAAHTKAQEEAQETAHTRAQDMVFAVEMHAMRPALPDSEGIAAVEEFLARSNIAEPTLPNRSGATDVIQSVINEPLMEHSINLDVGKRQTRSATKRQRLSLEGVRPAGVAVSNTCSGSTASTAAHSTATFAANEPESASQFASQVVGYDIGQNQQQLLAKVGAGMRSSQRLPTLASSQRSAGGASRLGSSNLIAFGRLCQAANGNTNTQEG
eukprot:jgi/Chlat1/3171/Chrsp22S03403